MQPSHRLLGGRYELTALIATGGMGQVWRAVDTRLARDVAVKVLRSEYTDDDTFLTRFRTEARLSAGLVHPNIATLFDYGEVVPEGPQDEHLAYLVMELVRGESLSVLRRREPRLSVERTLEVLRQCAAGLAAAHAAGVVHRDVKPGNVLLADDGRVKLTDFGVAVSTGSVPITQTGEVIGTAAYLSPEQVEGHRATPASDVYALGLVGYECLAGHLGFDGESSVQVALRRIREMPAPLPDDVPGPVRELIHRAIVKDPAVRFPDGAAFRAAIEDVVAGRPIGAPLRTPRTAVMPAVRATPIPPLPPMQTVGGPDGDHTDDAHGTGRDAGRHRWPLLVAALLVLLVAGGGAAAVQSMADRGDSTAAAGTPTTTSASAPPTSSAPTVRLISVSAADYVGRPVGEVQADLVERGLQVVLRPLQTADVPDGQVITMDPVGQVMPGTTVTLTYAVAPPTRTPAPTTAPTPQPVPTPTLPQTVDDRTWIPGWASGNGTGDDDTDPGNGKGNGKGRNG